MGKNDFSYRLIKGRIAEILIEELFLKSKYEVYRYGMENTVPGITQKLRYIESEEATIIKKMPDFAVLNLKTNKVCFIEVKFRANGSFKLSDLDENYPYTNAFIILVSKKNIKCIKVSELKAGKKITPTCGNYLSLRKEFDLAEDDIIDFCGFVVNFFENV